MKIENDKNTITANEINKFSYCPYQWYYERLYGRKELRALARERNKSLGLTDTTQGHLAAGSSYHAEIHKKYRTKQLVVKFIIILVLAVIIYALIKGVIAFPAGGSYGR